MICKHQQYHNTTTHQPQHRRRCQISFANHNKLSIRHTRSSCSRRNQQPTYIQQSITVWYNKYHTDVEKQWGNKNESQMYSSQTHRHTHSDHHGTITKTAFHIFHINTLQEQKSCLPKPGLIASATTNNDISPRFIHSDHHGTISKPSFDIFHIQTLQEQQFACRSKKLGLP